MFGEKESVFFSNTPLRLMQSVENELFSDQNPLFVHRYLIVPSLSIKPFFLKKWAQNPRLQIGAGVTFCTLWQFVKNITQKKGNFCSELELITHIYIKLDKYSRSDDPRFVSVNKYLEGNREKRKEILAQKLAALFLEYALVGNFSGDIQKNWQHQLFAEIFYEEKWSYYKRDLLSAIKNIEEENRLICLYAPSYIPKIFRIFFSQLSSKNRVCYFILSPSHLFIEDTLSDNEKRGIYRKILQEKKSSDLANHFEEIFDNSNALLANLIKEKKELLKVVDLYPNIPHDLYDISEDIHWGEKNNHQLSLLDAIKMDMAQLRNVVETGPFERIKIDPSIAIHQASSKYREVQIALLHLHREIAQGKWNLSDICIVIPHLEDYVPYIHRVFGDESQGIGYKIVGLDAFSRSFFAQGVQDFLSLIHSRWEKETFIRLLRNRSFYTSANLEQDEVETIISWIEKAQIEWGIDLDQRKKMAGNNDIYDRSFSWGLHRIFAAFIYSEDGDTHEEKSIDGIGFSDIGLYEKFLSVFHKMQATIAYFEKIENAPLSNWAKAIEEKVAELFAIFDDVYDQVEAPAFFSSLKKMRMTSKTEKEEVPFSMVFSLLIMDMKKQTVTYQGNYSNAVTICSASEFAPSPYHIIYLMGMNAPFPRIDSPSSLTFRNQCTDDYLPSMAQHDRETFLNMILCCNTQFIISYLEEPHSPALIVEEFVSYIDKAYRYKNEKVSPHLLMHHATFGFQKEEIAHFSYHLDYDYEGAKAYLSPYQPPSFSFFSQKETVQPEIIDIKYLFSLFHHPIRFFFQHVLQVYFDYEKINRDLFFPSFHFSKILKMSHRKSAEEIWRFLEKKQELPVGMFKDIAKKTMDENIQQYQDNLQRLHIEKEKIFDISFVPYCQRPHFKDPHLLLHPPLKIPVEGKEIVLIGTLENVCDQGLIIHKEDILKNTMKNLAEILVYNNIELEDHKKLCYISTGEIKQVSIENLEVMPALIRYYNKALQSLPPLDPSWAKALFCKDREQLKKEIRNISKRPYEDVYVNALLEQNSPDIAADIFQHWHSHFAADFLPMQKVIEEMS